MTCCNCGTTLVDHKERYIWNDPILGDIDLGVVKYIQCPKCKETGFHSETCKILERKIKEIEGETK